MHFCLPLNNLRHLQIKIVLGLLLYSNVSCSLRNKRFWTSEELLACWSRENRGESAKITTKDWCHVIAPSLSLGFVSASYSLLTRMKNSLHDLKIPARSRGYRERQELRRLIVTKRGAIEFSVPYR